VKTLVRYLVNAAGRNANLLLNIGPMADGKIQPQFTDTLLAVGNWMKKYGESIYGTRGNIISPQDWGVLTAKNKTIYVHIFKNPGQGYIFIPGLKTKVMKAVRMGENSNLRWKQQPEGVFIYTNGMDLDPVDTIIELQSQ
jgi:alpha-L-fucosidase